MTRAERTKGRKQKRGINLYGYASRIPVAERTACAPFAALGPQDPRLRQIPTQRSGEYL